MNYTAEMPTSGDLKSGDSLFHYPHQKIDPAPNRDGLGHNMKSCMNYILSKFVIIVLKPKLSLSVTKYVQKFPRNCTMNEKKFEFRGKNGLNLKLKHRKAQKMILYPGDLATCTGKREIGAVSGRVAIYAL